MWTNDDFSTPARNPTPNEGKSEYIEASRPTETPKAAPKAKQRYIAAPKCNYNTLANCSYSQKMQIRKEKATAASIKRDAEERERIASARAKKDRDKRYRCGESTVIERSDGSWSEIRSKRYKKGYW